MYFLFELDEDVRVTGFNNSGTYFCSTFKTSKANAFAHSSRKHIADPTISPGPGAYKRFSDFPVWSMQFGNNNIFENIINERVPPWTRGYSRQLQSLYSFTCSHSSNFCDSFLLQEMGGRTYIFRASARPQRKVCNRYWRQHRNRFLSSQIASLVRLSRDNWSQEQNHGGRSHQIGQKNLSWGANLIYTSWPCRSKFYTRVCVKHQKLKSRLFAQQRWSYGNSKEKTNQRRSGNAVGRQPLRPLLPHLSSLGKNHKKLLL